MNSRAATKRKYRYTLKNAVCKNRVTNALVRNNGCFRQCPMAISRFYDTTSKLVVHETNSFRNNHVHVYNSNKIDNFLKCPRFRETTRYVFNTYNVVRAGDFFSLFLKLQTCFKTYRVQFTLTGCEFRFYNCILIRNIKCSYFHTRDISLRTL